MGCRLIELHTKLNLLHVISSDKESNFRLFFTLIPFNTETTLHLNCIRKLLLLKVGLLQALDNKKMQ